MCAKRGKESSTQNTWKEARLHQRSLLWSEILPSSDIVLDQHSCLDTVCISALIATAVSGFPSPPAPPFSLLCVVKGEVGFFFCYLTHDYTIFFSSPHAFPFPVCSIHHWQVLSQQRGKKVRTSLSRQQRSPSTTARLLTPVGT